MLDRIFDTDNVVFRFFNTLGYIWWLHILWLVCSLPIITLGASTTALCYSCMKLHHRDGYVTRNFFHSFKENFRQATILFLIFAAAGGMLLLDLILCGQGSPTSVKFIKYGAIALLIPYFMTLLYAFAIQSKFVHPVLQTLRFAFLVAWRYFGYTLQIALVVAAVLVLNMTIVLANYATLSIGVGLVAYVLCLYYDKIFMEIIARSNACKSPEIEND